MAKPALYAALVKLYKVYWQLHGNLPKAFRFTTGEQILRELSACVALCATVTFAEKGGAEQRRETAGQLRELRSRLEGARALLTVGWELKFVSHNVMAHLSAALDDAGRQTVRWRQWLEKGNDV